jgi:hypothetical protein
MLAPSTTKTVTILPIALILLGWRISTRVRASESSTDIGRSIVNAKGLASAILRLSHLEHSKALNDGVWYQKTLHDQYATVI